MYSNIVIEHVDLYGSVHTHCVATELFYIIIE